MRNSNIFKGIVTTVIILTALFIVWQLWQVVLYVVASAVLAIVGRPLMRYIANLKLFGRTMPRSAAAACTLIVMWLFVGALGTLFIPPIFSKFHELATLDWDVVVVSIEAALANVKSGIEELFSTQISDMGATFRDFVLERVDVNFANTFSNLSRFVVSCGIAVFSISFITFYFLKEEGLFYRLVTTFFPDRYRNNVHHALDSVTKLLSRYFRGILLESLVLMIIISIVMLICGMRFGDALIIGLIIGTLNVIPYAGPFIGCFIALCIGVLSPIDGDIIYTATVIVSTIVGVKLIDDFMIQPTLYSGRVNAHPLEIFLLILAAGTIAGLVGILLAIPLYTIVRVFALEFFSEYSLVRKLTTQMRKEL